MPTVLIELPGGAGMVCRDDGEVVITQDVSDDRGQPLRGRGDYRPAQTWLDDVRSIVAGRLPPSAVSAEVVDDRGTPARITGSGSSGNNLTELTVGHYAAEDDDPFTAPDLSITTSIREAHDTVLRRARRALEMWIYDDHLHPGSTTAQPPRTAVRAPQQRRRTLTASHIPCPHNFRTKGRYTNTAIRLGRRAGLVRLGLERVSVAIAGAALVRLRNLLVERVLRCVIEQFAAGWRRRLGLLSRPASDLAAREDVRSALGPQA